MIGIVPSSAKTFEVFGTTDDTNPIEDKLYYRPSDGRLFYHSKSDTRSNPSNGYYPVWDGKCVYESSFSNHKYYPADVTIMDIEYLASTINREVATDVIYKQRKSDNDTILKPTISDDDNTFTQCVKGVINQMQINMIDLYDMAPDLTQKQVDGMYAALNKIAFMRLEKWNIWINMVLHVHYTVKVLKDDKCLITYAYPSNEFDTGIVKYDSIINSKDDPFKKIVKILMVMENITKATLRTMAVDDYTINNLMTTITSNKSLSAQLFSRFIRMSHLSYVINIYDASDNMIFEYKEQQISQE